MSFGEIDLQWFAAEDEGRTEDPSDYKLKKAREEGRVAKSPELSSAIVMVATVAALIVSAHYLFKGFAELLVFFFTRCTEQDVLQKRFFSVFLISMARMVLPLALVGALAGVLANIVQNRGFLFSLKPIEPQPSKVAPRIGQYLKKTLFSFEGGFNVVKSLAKVAAVAAAAFLIISSGLPRVLALLHAVSVPDAVGVLGGMAAKILVACSLIFLGIAVPDYFVQKRQFIESLKMTKQEVKQEYKEMEGDPEVKGHLEQAQRQLLQRNMPAQVAKSDVVITNPTHFAVALYYDRTIADGAPQVMAKGADERAFRIREIAKEHDVPIVEDRPLARSLYAETEIGDIIPSAYFNAIAIIYAQIDSISKKK